MLCSSTEQIFSQVRQSKQNHNDKIRKNLPKIINKYISILAPSELQYEKKCHQKYIYSKTCVKQPLSKRPKIGFQDQLSFNAGQKYCRMLQGEHSAILLTFIKLPFVIKIFFLSIFDWPFYTDFTVLTKKATNEPVKFQLSDHELLGAHAIFSHIAALKAHL